jgi:hypothetical protein
MTVVKLDDLPQDIIEIIYAQFDFPSQLNLKSASKHFVMYPITNLSDNLPETYCLTDQILKLYPQISKLKISDKSFILHISPLSILTTLHIKGNMSKVIDSTVKFLTNLTELSITSNKKITDINCLTNLRTLYSNVGSDLTTTGILALTNLAKLHISSGKIIDINHLINLRTLSMEDTGTSQCGIIDKGISALTNLTELNVNWNSRITDVRSLINLRTLHCGGRSCGIGNSSTRFLTNLTNLYACNNSRITDINHLENLRTLYASGSSGIDDKGLAFLTKLHTIYSYNNKKIREIQYVKNVYRY